VAKGALAAGGAAASLTRRAGAAARQRMDRPSPPPAPRPPVAAPEPELEVAPGQDTTTWQRVEEIEFPDRGPEPVTDPFPEPTPFPEPDQQESAARAAARHYRRLRHSEQRGPRRAPAPVASASSPPRLPRPVRERQHLPLRAHGPRDLALPAGLVVIAALVIMAVAGVFGGGSSTPPAGTQANAAPVIAPVTQSVTSISTAEAVRLAASRSPHSTSTTTTP
jgi:hypothetical protein